MVGLDDEKIMGGDERIDSSESLSGGEELPGKLGRLSYVVESVAKEFPGYEGVVESCNDSFEETYDKIKRECIQEAKIAHVSQTDVDTENVIRELRMQGVNFVDFHEINVPGAHKESPKFKVALQEANKFDRAIIDEFGLEPIEDSYSGAKRFSTAESDDVLEVWRNVGSATDRLRVALGNESLREMVEEYIESSDFEQRSNFENAETSDLHENLPADQSLIALGEAFQRIGEADVDGLGEVASEATARVGSYIEAFQKVYEEAKSEAEEEGRVFEPRGFIEYYALQEALPLTIYEIPEMTTNPTVGPGKFHVSSEKGEVAKKEMASFLTSLNYALSLESTEDYPGSTTNYKSNELGDSELMVNSGAGRHRDIYSIQMRPSPEMLESMIEEL